MTTRTDVERLRLAGRDVVTLAQRDLSLAFRSLSLDDPALVRDVLLDLVPSLVREYGDIAAAAAAEWYEEVRAAQLGGVFNAQTVASFPREGVEAGVRYAVDHLFTGNPEETLSIISGALQRYVTYSSRETVARNVQLDPARPRFARVPSGKTTCAWCYMLSSRGFVYHSAASAGDLGAVGDDFHDDCDCQVVAEFDRTAHHIEGYDPDRAYDMYLEARTYADSDSPKDIAAAMRSLFPEFTDSHVH